MDSQTEQTQSITAAEAERQRLRWREAADRAIERVEITTSEQRNLLIELAQGEPNLSQAKELLEEAKERALPQKRKAAYKPGEIIRVSVTPWCVEGLLRGGVNNLIVALPKVGKSALNGAFVGAWAKDADDFLGRKISQRCTECHLIWPDMPLEDAVYILEREGLWDGTGVIKDKDGNVIAIEGSPKAPIVELVTAELDIREWDFRPTNLGRYRKEALDAKKRGVKAFWSFDCYEVMCSFEPGFNENDPSAGRPAREMCLAFAGTDATTMVNHHSNKTGGGTAVIAGSGHASISRPFSTCTELKWLRPAKEGATQTDMRVSVSQIGRRKGSQWVIELTDEGWISHGQSDEASKEEYLEEQWLKLDKLQQKAFDHIVSRTRMGFGVTVEELMGTITGPDAPSNREHMRRPLRALKKKGLLRVDEKALKKTGPGVAADLWYAEFDPETQGNASPSPYTLSAGSQIKKGDVIDSNLSKGDQTQNQGVEPIQTGGGKDQYTPHLECNPHSEHVREWGAISSTLYMQPVELFENGKWFNGWKCTKCDSPDDLHLFKVVDGEIWKRSGKRWELDVRRCTQANAVE